MSEFKGYSVERIDKIIRDQFEFDTTFDEQLDYSIKSFASLFYRDFQNGLYNATYYAKLYGIPPEVVHGFYAKFIDKVYKSEGVLSKGDSL